MSGFIINPYAFGAGTPAAFAPDDIAGLELWLDADDDSTITEASGVVSQWDDKSSNARHFTAASGQRPTTGSTTLNSKNVIRFNGSSHRMTRASFMHALVGHTLLIVTRSRIAITSNQQLLAEANTGTPNQFAAYGNVSASPWQDLRT